MVAMYAIAMADAVASKGREVLSNLLVSTHHFRNVQVNVATFRWCRLVRQSLRPARRKSVVVSRLQHAKDILAGCGLGNRRQRAKSTQRVQLRDESCRGVVSGRSSCRPLLDSTVRSLFRDKRHDLRDKCGIGDRLDDFAENRLFCAVANPTMAFVQLSGEPR